jgi:hypothetical protein
MCYAYSALTAARAGWAGCGQHVDAVMRSVPASERCTCSETFGAKTNARR